MFYLHVEILRRGYLVLTAGFCKRLHHRFIDIPSPDRRVTFALSSNYQLLLSRITFRRTDWSVVTIRYNDQSVRLYVIRDVKDFQNFNTSPFLLLSSYKFPILNVTGIILWSLTILFIFLLLSFYQFSSCYHLFKCKYLK